MNQLRLAYIEAAIIVRGQVCTQDIMDMFNIKRVSASRDFRRYREAYPDNIEYNVVFRRYKPSKSFERKALLFDAKEFLIHLIALEHYF